MAELVYLLCALTSSLCALLLIRSYVQSKLTLLLWSGLCFVGLALNNILLLLDVLGAVPDLAVERTLAALAGVLCLVIGLVWGSR